MSVVPDQQNRKSYTLQCCKGLRRVITSHIIVCRCSMDQEHKVCNYFNTLSILVPTLRYCEDDKQYKKKIKCKFS